MTTAKKCANCSKHDTVLGGDQSIQMICRARPPRVTVALVPVGNGGFRTVQANNWPQVNKDDWCGEFEPGLVH